MPYDAVLLIAFGGPTRPEEIRPFLEIVTRGRRIPPARLEEVAHHYERMPGGRSPLNELTRAQASRLEAALARDGRTLPVFVGMRNWHPFLHETLAEMAARGHHRVLGLILSVLRCEASWDRYRDDVAAARARTPGAPEVEFTDPWFAHAGHLDAVAARARDALAGVPAAHRARAPLVFTAHSIPVAMADEAPYVSELTAVAHAVAGRVGRTQYSIAYQSRSGAPGDRWLEPDINDVLRTLAEEKHGHAVVVPAGFVCDHVEVLYDLDVEARATAAAAGLTLHRAAAVNDHPDFIAALADVVRRTERAAA
ncbi:MAG: ferrochelatase [Candidatus Rokubacteria bacterium]|nr:ferrochelatase [Candidatus Rokubacteria bacterium]